MSVAGVEGNGQSELAEVLTGMKKPMLGQVKISGMEVLDYSPAEFRRKQVVYIPEDRMAVGCAADMTISENMFADKIQRYLIRNIFLDRKRMDAKAKEWVKDFNVLCTSAEQDVNMLSGGNIQKVVAARELTENVGIVVAEQPTRGIDAGASELIRTKLVELRDRGVAVLLISADLNEILELSDSCIVMYNGKINAYFKDTTNLTEEELGYYMLGVKKQSEEEVRALL